MRLSDYTKIRLFEIMPGLLVWLTFILAIVFSFVKPIWVIYFIIIFDLYWVFRVSYFVFYLVISWNQYRQTIVKDWLAILKNHNSGWKDIYHLVFLPTYKEPLDVLKTTFEALVNTKYPLNQFIVVLAGEERDKDNFLKNAEFIRKKYGHNFFKFLATVHPKGLPNEIPGKGSNNNWAGHQVKELIDELKIPYEKIIVSAFDIDTCVHPQYFAYLTHQYLNHPDPTHTSYQPIALYNNNMWESSPLLRVAAYGTTFWLMTELARPERLYTFSSHSMSFKALVDVGFWEKDIVTEDSRIFLQCLIYYKGNYSVMPMYIPVSMDTVETGKWRKSLTNLYKQQRRWAWGVEHFPYMLWHFLQNKEGRKIPWYKKFYYFWNLGEGMYSWATAPILIFILGRLPMLTASESLRSAAVFQNAPFVLEWLMSLAMIGIFISAVTSLMLLPPKPLSQPRYKILIMILQWLLLPITLIAFGSIPAIEAQTRLMLGGRFRLGFWVTEKARK